MAKRLHSESRLLALCLASSLDDLEETAEGTFVLRVDGLC
jgi:hypothetical protein